MYGDMQHWPATPAWGSGTGTGGGTGTGVGGGGGGGYGPVSASPAYAAARGHAGGQPYGAQGTGYSGVQGAYGSYGGYGSSGGYEGYGHGGSHAGQPNPTAYGSYGAYGGAGSGGTQWPAGAGSQGGPGSQAWAGPAVQARGSPAYSTAYGAGAPGLQGSASGSGYGGYGGGYGSGGGGGGGYGVSPGYGAAPLASAAQPMHAQGADPYGSMYPGYGATGASGQTTAGYGAYQGSYAAPGSYGGSTGAGAPGTAGSGGAPGAAAGAAGYGGGSGGYGGYGGYGSYGAYGGSGGYGTGRSPADYQTTGRDSYGYPGQARGSGNPYDMRSGASDTQRREAHGHAGSQSSTPGPGYPHAYDPRYAQPYDFYSRTTAPWDPRYDGRSATDPSRSGHPGSGSSGGSGGGGGQPSASRHPSSTDASRDGSGSGGSSGGGSSRSSTEYQVLEAQRQAREKKQHEQMARDMYNTLLDMGLVPPHGFEAKTADAESLTRICSYMTMNANRDDYVDGVTYCIELAADVCRVGGTAMSCDALVEVANDWEEKLSSEGRGGLRYDIRRLHRTHGMINPITPQQSLIMHLCRPVTKHLLPVVAMKAAAFAERVYKHFTGTASPDSSAAPQIAPLATVVEEDDLDAALETGTDDLREEKLADEPTTDALDLAGVDEAALDPDIALVAEALGPEGDAATGPSDVEALASVGVTVGTEQDDQEALLASLVEQGAQEAWQEEVEAADGAEPSLVEAARPSGDATDASGSESLSPAVAESPLPGAVVVPPTAPASAAGAISSEAAAAVAMDPGSAPSRVVRRRSRSGGPVRRGSRTRGLRSETKRVDLPEAEHKDPMSATATPEEAALPQEPEPVVADPAGPVAVAPSSESKEVQVAEESAPPSAPGPAVPAVPAVPAPLVGGASSGSSGSARSGSGRAGSGRAGPGRASPRVSESTPSRAQTLAAQAAAQSVVLGGEVKVSASREATRRPPIADESGQDGPAPSSSLSAEQWRRTLATQDVPPEELPDLRGLLRIYNVPAVQRRAQRITAGHAPLVLGSDHGQMVLNMLNMYFNGMPRTRTSEAQRRAARESQRHAPRDLAASASVPTAPGPSAAAASGGTRAAASGARIV